MRPGKIHKWMLPMALVICLLLSVTVFAQQTGSLLLKNISHSVTLYQIADADNNLEDAFANAQINVAESTQAVTNARRLQKFAVDNGIAGDTKAPDAAKQVMFDSLEKGCYLVCSQAQPEDFVPFLIWIPTALGEETIYDIQAEPKTEDPTDPDQPDQPVTPEPNIPQTGIIQWPKYVLLSLGAAAIFVGAAEMIRGGRKSNE